MFSHSDATTALQLSGVDINGQPGAHGCFLLASFYRLLCTKCNGPPVKVKYTSCRAGEVIMCEAVTTCSVSVMVYW